MPFLLFLELLLLDDLLHDVGGEELADDGVGVLQDAAQVEVGVQRAHLQLRDQTVDLVEDQDRTDALVPCLGKIEVQGWLEFSWHENGTALWGEYEAHFSDQ